MTRYTQSAGTSGSYKRIPEEGTPWNKLKKNTTQESDQPTDKFLENNGVPFNCNTDVKSRVSKLKRKQNSSKVQISWNKSNLNVPEESESVAVEDKVNDRFKKKDNKTDYKRRKPITDIPPISIDGVETKIARFEGFPVKKVDADRLKELKRQLIASNVPRNDIQATLKQERRKAEKALARARKKTCFHCRCSGHVLSECPQLSNKDVEQPSSGICFKCGSTEHQHTECHVVRDDNYKYAVCFICKEEGHISRQCPDNPRGLYLQGGACRICGDVTHMKKDCPKFITKKEKEFTVTLKTLDNRTPDALDEDYEYEPIEEPLKKKKKKGLKMNK